MTIKFLPSLLILFVLSSCSNSPQKEITTDSTIRIGDSFFEDAIYNSYVENGKYYLIKCHSWFLKQNHMERNTESVFEINVGDFIQGRPDHHNSIHYVVEKLSGNDMQFGYEYSFDHRSFGVKEIIKGRGSFIIHCTQKKEFVRLIVEGLEVNAASARQHIRQGKFYILLKFNNERGEGDRVGWDFGSKQCTKAIFNKFGYYEYILDQCVPTEFHRQQINAYNTEVFNYLKDKKGLKFSNYEEMNRQYELERNECGMAEYKKRNNK
jgi:hypothetical protein